MVDMEIVFRQDRLRVGEKTTVCERPGETNAALATVELRTSACLVSTGDGFSRDRTRPRPGGEPGGVPRGT